MMTIQAVRKDLSEIRYYFARKKRLDDVSELVGNNKVVDMVERYNVAMQNAPIRLYDLFNITKGSKLLNFDPFAACRCPH